MYKNKKYRSGISNTVSQMPKSIKTNLGNVECSSPKMKKINVPENVSGITNTSDMSSIPASQPPTQRRYLSQRSLMSCKSQTKHLNRAANSYFEMILMKAGADLDQENVIILAYDNITFVNRLYNLLNKNQDNPNAVDDFVEGLTECFNNRPQIIKLLTGCKTNIKSRDLCAQLHDSIIVNILMVEVLQPKIVQVLLDKIEEIVEVNNSSDDFSLLPLLLVQLKLIASSYVELIYDRLLKIFEIATPAAKDVIMLNIEFVLDPMKHDDFVCYLLQKYLENAELLNKSTLQMLMNFSLSLSMQRKIKERILQYIEDNCDINLIPSFLKFLLISIEDDDRIFIEVITDLRNCLCCRYNDLKNKSNLQSEIFTSISQALTRSRKMFDNWLKIIQSLKENSIKSIDFVILLMLISIREEKSNVIKNLLRRWITNGQIKVDVINDMKNIYFTVLEDYKDLLFRILYDFLCEKNTFLLKFAKETYKILFTIDENYKKKVLKKLVELICNKSSSNSSLITLEILNNLYEKYVNEIQTYGLLLLPLLDHVYEMDLTEYRTVLELLCSVSYRQSQFQECMVLKDQIDMLVKKQISSQNSFIQKQGVIGAVQLLYHISCTEVSHDKNIYDVNISYETSDDLPEGRGKLAASYIIRITSSIVYCVESLALFYNELAILLSSKNKRKANIDRHFLIWLCDLITSYFKNFFIVEDVPQGFPLKLFYKNCINSLDDDSKIESPIAVNICGPVLKPPAQAAKSIITLPPLFNLMRVLYSIRHNGSLASIDAVLGCAIILPESLDDLIEMHVIENYNEDMTKKIIDIHFHLINWYREIIGSFANQNEKTIREKVLLRLNELIKLEDTFHELLLHPTATNYIPPRHEFITSTTTIGVPVFKKPIGKPKKALHAQKSNQNRGKNENDDKILNQKQHKHKLMNTKKLDYLFRQMDFNILLILREELYMKFPLSNEEIGHGIGLLEFKFILSDLVDKLESITGVRKVISDKLLQYLKNSSDLIGDIIHFLPIIKKHFEQFTEKIFLTIKAVNGAMSHVDLFTDEFNYIKICHGLCIRIFAAVFLWSDIKDVSNNELLKAALCTINDIPVESKNNTKHPNELAENAFNNFIKLENCILDLRSAVYLLNLCSSLSKFSTNSDLEKSVCNLCKTFLNKKWYNYTGTQEKGAESHILMNELLCGLFKKYDFKMLKEISHILLDDIKLLKKNDDNLKTFPNINKINFPIIFKHLCSTLITIINESIQNEIPMLNELKLWEQACEVLNKLLNIVKSLDLPRNFSLFLKYSHNFLKIFIQHGLSIFEKYLRKDPERANELLKTLQTSTRFLHNLCCHSKAIKQYSMVAQIPFVRETVENLVFKVKAALAANKCSSVFWMGDLKNKDLHGDVILSQASYSNDIDDDDKSTLNDEDGDSDINETVIEHMEKKSSSQSNSL